LRVRLLIGQGKRDEARAVLAMLPVEPRAVVQSETINLLKAERFLLAPTFEDLLANAPRAIVRPGETNRVFVAGRPARRAETATGTPGFDEDGAIVFTRRLPLARLVQASQSTVLPDRLRARVAIAAFTRALLLRRSDAALEVLPHLKSLAPVLSADLDRYADAKTAADRHLAGIRLLLRTPGMHTSVRGIDDDVSYVAADPVRAFDHVFTRNWWCGSAPEHRIAAFPGDTVLLGLLYAAGDVPFPEFLSQDERAETETELKALAAVGPAPDYLATEAIAWARARPGDSDAAEALAHAVEGGRWGCGGPRNPELSRRAFQTLHRQFPQSAWAKQMKYWYE
jgi:hypothetical protein